LIAEQFQDRLVQILLAVAVLSAVFGVLQHNGGTAAAVESESILKALVEPSVILAILVLNAATGVWQSMSANDSLVALQKMQADVCRVARNDKLLEIPAAELVPGDVLLVQVGDKIAADARLLSLEQSLSLKVDQGSLTGESVTVGKLPGDDGTVAANSPVQDQKGMLFAGTMVTAGRGKAVVVQTGMDTQFGKIQAGVTEAAATQVKTPLAIKLDDFGEQLTLIIGVICLAVWIVSIPKMNDPSFANVWQGGIYYAKVAVALGVAAIPEGLPAVITLCLSLGTRRMAERNVIVRKLPSVETLGCVTVICTDKTGTLTQNGTYRKLVD
jgi:Ca2+-transporting ATPase